MSGTIEDGDIFAVMHRNVTIFDGSGHLGDAYPTVFTVGYISIIGFADSPIRRFADSPICRFAVSTGSIGGAGI